MTRVQDTAQVFVKSTLLVLCSITVLGQSNREPCVLDTAKNGDLVKFRGEASAGGHDAFILPASCVTSSSNHVILVWADDPSLSAGRTTVRRDETFSEFNRLLKATFPLPPNSVGQGQPRYQVVADFEGRLEVSLSAGFKRNPKSNKIVGIEGFGHPLPFTRFRLLATGVSRIESKRAHAGHPVTPVPAP